MIFLLVLVTLVVTSKQLDHGDPRTLDLLCSQAEHEANKGTALIVQGCCNSDV